MAATRGSREDNPLLLLESDDDDDDDDDDVQEIPAPKNGTIWTATQDNPAQKSKSRAYFALDSDEELKPTRPGPSTEIPSSARTTKKGIRTNANSNRRSNLAKASFAVRPRENRPQRGSRRETSPIPISSDDEDDDELESVRPTSRADGKSRPPSGPNAAISSAGDGIFDSASGSPPEKLRSLASSDSVPNMSPSKATTRDQPMSATSTAGKEKPALPDPENRQLRPSVPPSGTSELPTRARNVTPVVTRETIPESQHSPKVQASSDLQLLRPSPSQQFLNPIPITKPILVQPDKMVHNQKSSVVAPIGARAEREQTTDGHVETNATSTSGRVSSISEAEKDVASEFPKRSATREPKPLRKPRMVKRAISPPQQRQQSVGSSARNAWPLGGQRVPKEAIPVRKAREVPSNDRGLKPIIPSPIPFTGRAEMGAQVSATAVAPSEEITNGVNKDVSFSPPEFESNNASPNTIEVLDGIASISAQGAANPSVDDYDIVLPLDVFNTEGNQVGNLNRQAIESHLRRRLDERYEDHAYFVKNAMWRQRTCFEREIRAQNRGDRTKKKYQLSEKYIQTVSPFAKMPVIQTPLEKGHNKDHTKEISQEIFLKGTLKDSVIKSNWSVPTVTYRTGGVRIPSFKEYVSLKTNILADNESKLMTLPYLGDADDKKAEEAQEELIRKLPTVYEIRHDINAVYDFRQEQCRFFTESVDEFLVDIGLTWDAILYWLLVPDERLKEAVGNTRKSSDVDLLDRSAYEIEEFQRDGKKKAILFVRGPNCWRGLLSQLKALSIEEIWTSALVCAAIFANCNLSPWYIASRCETMQKYVRGKTSARQSTQEFSFRSIACRVCHTHNCLFHGQIREQPRTDDESSEAESSAEDDSNNPETLNLPRPGSTLQKIDSNDSQESDSSSGSILVPAHYDDDSDVENIVNYRLPINPEVLANDAVPDFDAPEIAIPPPGPWRTSWWEKNTTTSKWETRKPFIPCNHEGSCTAAKCRCFREGITCEKSCKCSKLCNRRFPGCNCASAPGKRLCGTEKCLCVKFARECDADLCDTCGATEILDPINRYNEDVLKDRCTNVGIQRGVPKKTLLGQSEVHGFGLYMGQDVTKDDIIGEYTGEIISVEESIRREIVYEYQRNMYLFKLNKEQEVDATYMGNKLRFINNANQNLTNCYPKVLLCNTVFRVAIYATTNIKAGTELFFHYNYPADVTRHFKQPSGNVKVYAVKQAVKPPAKAKPTKPMSRTSSYKTSEPSSAAARIDKPRVHDALAKARAAKAVKHEIMLAEKGAEGLPSNRRLGQKQARKSVGGGGVLLHRAPKQSDSRSPSRPARGFGNSANLDDPSGGVSPWEDNGSVSNLVVPDTDEDDDFIPPDTQEDADVDDALADEEYGDADSERQYGNIGLRRPSKPLARLRKSAPSLGPVVAVIKVKKKMGGARPGAGRKRKRPLVVNSEDEV